MPEILKVKTFRMSDNDLELLNNTAARKNITPSACIRLAVQSLDEKSIEYQKKPRRPKITVTEEERLNFNYYRELLYVRNTLVHMAQSIDDLRGSSKDVILLDILVKLHELDCGICQYFEDFGK